jgi:3alpha(or 20beta)-hydroxysteroid dehydrogenase
VGRVEGKVALITGGARGMDAEHARLLVSEGAKVVIGDVLDDEGRSVATQLGEDAHYLHLDVTQPEQWAFAVDEAVRRFGRLDVLVNNAGVAGRKTVRKFELDRWRHTLDVNLTGTFLGTQAVVDEMIRSGKGSIINISSIEGLRGAPFAHAYVASKWAVRGLTKSTAIELGRYNIRVNSVHPGLVRTPMTAHFPDDIVAAPLGRPAEPIEVSNLVLYLASDESSYSTGSEFVVDGGVTADTPRKDLMS